MLFANFSAMVYTKKQGLLRRTILLLLKQVLVLFVAKQQLV